MIAMQPKLIFLPLPYSLLEKKHFTIEPEINLSFSGVMEKAVFWQPIDMLLLSHTVKLSDITSRLGFKVH